MKLKFIDENLSEKPSIEGTRKLDEFDFITKSVVDMEIHVLKKKKQIEDYISAFKLKDAAFMEHLRSALN